MGQVGLGDADAAVADGDGPAAGGDAYGLAAGIFEGVAHEVVKGHVQQVGIAADRELVGAVYTAAAGGDGLQERAHLHGLGLRYRLAAADMREMEQFAHYGHHAVGLVGHTPQCVAIFGARAVGHERHLTLALYRRQRVVDLVRGVVDEHLLPLVVAVDTVDHADGVEPADEPEDCGGDDHQH